MEVRALCITLVTTVMILLCAHGRKVDAAALRVEPNKSQFFEYDPVTFFCEGVSFCVVENSKGKKDSCNTTNKKTSMGSSCSITTLYTEDSGEFWFEAAGGKKSNSVNITVQRGSVILESPALLVMEGDAATLSCRNKMASSNLTAVFYKDGFPIWNNSTGTVTINSVSKSNEGRYKCHISGGGESPESWLVVRDSTHSDGDKQTAPSSSTPWIIITVALMLLLVVVGLHHFGNRVVPCLGSVKRPTASAASAVAPLASSEANASDATYAVVRKNRKNDEGTSSSLPLYYTLDLGGTQLPEAGISNITATSDLSSGTNQCVMEDPFYSAIQ